MHTPASIAGHPLHPILVAIPIGLWVFSLACDIVWTAGNGQEYWAQLAFATMVGGIIGALLAAVPGIIDMLSLPQPPRRTAQVHMTINLLITALYAANAWIRHVSPEKNLLWLSALCILLLGISGWLGGKLIYIYGVAVSER